jgi:glycosyltransferase involved in cell wall biosynthesis
MKIGVVITTYNRPEYLRQCLHSIGRSDIPESAEILIVDDHSDDEETIAIIAESGIRYFAKAVRSGIKHSLATGLQMLINSGCDVLINLDGDAKIRNDYFARIIELHEKFPDNIITGFNCNTLNSNGSIRHLVTEVGDGWNMKKTVGGINFCITPKMFYDWMLSALREPVGNFDQKTCLNAGNGVICAVPSIVDHLGIRYSMGHTSGIEKADTANDFKSLHLPDVTLIIVDDDVMGAVEVVNKSCEDIEFGSVKILSYNYHEDSRWWPIHRIGSKEAYSFFMFDEIIKFIDTKYFLVIQQDGYVLNTDAWTNEFLNYDYIGALWSFRPEGFRNGNGGLSIRSKRLHEVIRDDKNIILRNDHLVTNFAEDHNLGVIYREYLELKHGIKFAPDSLCDQFSIEAWGKTSIDKNYKGSFGFHGKGIVFDNLYNIKKPY